MAGTLAAGMGTAAASTPPDQAAKGLHYDGLQPAADGPCKGIFALPVSAAHGGLAGCTHGPDAAPDGIDVRVNRAPETSAETALRAAIAAAPAPAPLCVGDGTSGQRVQLVYANITGNADRYPTYASSFPVWAAATDAVYDTSAAETGGHRRIRFVHDASCVPVVARVTLSSAAANDFDKTITELANLGYNRTDRKYLVWVDANVYCGIAQVRLDDQPGQQNSNNTRTGVARVDNGCWGVAGQSIEAHELMHNLGGVQTSAPHSTPYNHCTDDADRMCYADGSGAVVTQVCPASHENVFDCNHDDYFNTAPAAGSYLATHWNTANSAWLLTPPSSTAPGPPSGVSGVAGEGSVTLSWTAPASDGGSAITGYVVTPFEGTTAKPARTFASTATTQTVAGLTNDVAQTFKVAAVNAAGTGAPSAASAQMTPSAGSRFNPLPPARLLDTRTGTGAPAAAVGPGASIDLQVTGRGGVPADGVSAVVLNTTVVEPASGGYLTVWPAGEAQPLASNLNFTGMQTVANLVVVKVGAGGKVSLYNAGGATNLVADVAGWYGASGATAGSLYHALDPVRILDTRVGQGAGAAPVAGGATLDLQVTGQGGVPASGVSAVVLNVTVTEPASGGYLTVFPAGDARPLASNLNFSGGQTLANLVMVKVGAGGKVSLFDGGGTVQLIADVAGWFGGSGETTGAHYHPVTPTRLLDTRVAIGSVQLPIPSLGSIDLQLTGRAMLPPSGVSAVILNTTVVDPLAGGYLTTWPAGMVRPVVSNLNFVTGQTLPNLAVVKLGAGGKVSIFDGGGAANVIADLAGWYGAG